ncbi:hypothetical protein [Coleofasciculus sp.]|uniref:hypothetical protein n=1 Tax=Coleofasciculus sp. TaxID=3100458 RepID=UPI003A2D67B4
MKAIVLTCDTYIYLVDHLIYTYQKVWPSNPFTFIVPYGDEDGEYAQFLKEKYKNKIELIYTEAARVIHPVEQEVKTAERIKKVSLVKPTMLKLLENIPDEEWIFWSMDDRYLIKLKTKDADDIYNYLANIQDKTICFVRLLRGKRFLKDKFIKKESGITINKKCRLIETIYTDKTAIVDIWEPQFLRAKVLRRIFENFPNRPFIPKEMDLLTKEKLVGEKCYVPEKNLIVFGESTHRGQLTENCVASHKKWGLEITQNFEVSKKYHVTGELPYQLLGIKISLPKKLRKTITSWTRWYWRNK